MYYTPILFDIMALYKKRSQCSRSSQVSGTALLVSRGSGGEVGGRPPENLARPRSEPLPRAWGADLNSSRACAVSEPSGPALAHMCTTRGTAGAQGVPRAWQERNADREQSAFDEETPRGCRHPNKRKNG